MARHTYRDERPDMESSPGLWRDISQIKLGYLVLLGVFVIGGTIYRISDDIDDDAAIASRSSEVRRAPADFIRVQKRNKSYISAIEIGRSQREVIQAIGQPAFKQWYSNGFEMFMYRVERRRDDSLTTKDETAALVFQDAKLVGFTDTGKWFDNSVVHYNNANYYIEQARNKKLLQQLKNGASRTSIIDSLGRPAFVDYPGDDFEILSYRTRSGRGDNQTTRDETTAVLLMHGKLAGMDLDAQNTISWHNRSEHWGSATQTEPRSNREGEDDAAEDIDAGEPHEAAELNRQSSEQIVRDD